MRRGMKLLTVVGMLVATAARADPSPPVFPQQFTASITIEAHHCDKTKEYPPCMKYLQVHYDYPARKAKILFEHTKRVKVSRYDEVRATEQPDWPTPPAHALGWGAIACGPILCCSGLRPLLGRVCLRPHTA